MTGMVKNRKTSQPSTGRLGMCPAVELDLNITHYVDLYMSCM